MSFGYGDNDGVQNYGNVQEGWQGAPYDGVDLMGHAGVMPSWHSNLPTDTYLFLVIIGSLVALWLLGGIAFRSARI